MSEEEVMAERREAREDLDLRAGYSRRDVLKTRRCRRLVAAASPGSWPPAAGRGGGDGGRAPRLPPSRPPAATGRRAETAAARRPRRPARPEVPAGACASATSAAARPSRSTPRTGSTFIDASRYYNLYDPLARVSPDSRDPARARARVDAERRLDGVGDQAARPTSSGTTARPFTADDVIYTMG